jgi:hypothetical protein
MQAAVYGIDSKLSGFATSTSAVVIPCFSSKEVAPRWEGA